MGAIFKTIDVAIEVEQSDIKTMEFRTVPGFTFRIYTITLKSGEVYEALADQTGEPVREVFTINKLSEVLQMSFIPATVAGIKCFVSVLK